MYGTVGKVAKFKNLNTLLNLTTKLYISSARGVEMSHAKAAIKIAFEGLDKHIETNIVPKLTPLEGRRKRRHFISRLVVFSLILVLIPYGLHVLWETTKTEWTWADKIVPNIAFWCVGALGAAMLGSKLTKSVKTDGKDILMSGIVEHLGWTYAARAKKPAVMEYLTQIKMHNPFSIEEYEDEISGEALRHKFTLTEAKLSGGLGHGKGKNRKSFDFTGVILSVEFPKRTFGSTILRRVANDLEWRNIKVLKKIGFADPEFTETYQVFGSDPVEAYYLFSLDIMVTLIDAAKYMGGELTACIFWKGRLNLMIATADKFEMKTSAKSFTNDAQFEQVKRDISSIYMMIEKVEYYLTHRDPKEFQSKL